MADTALAGTTVLVTGGTGEVGWGVWLLSLPGGSNPATVRSWVRQTRAG